MKTTKIKAVLIALDYNPTSQKVAEFGYAVAKSMDAEVTLLHVLICPSTLYESASANMGAWQMNAANIVETHQIIVNSSHIFLTSTLLNVKLYNHLICSYI